MQKGKYCILVLTCLICLINFNDLSAQDPQSYEQSGAKGETIFDTDVAGGIPREDCYTLRQTAPDDPLRVMYNIEIGNTYDPSSFPCDVKLRITTPYDEINTFPDKSNVVILNIELFQNELDEIECIEGKKRVEIIYEFICIENGETTVLTIDEVYGFLGQLLPTGHQIASPDQAYQYTQVIEFCCDENLEEGENATDFRYLNNNDLGISKTDIAAISLEDNYQISFYKANFQRNIEVVVYDFSGRILSTTKALLNPDQESFNVKKPNNLHELYLLSINIDGEVATKKVLNY